MQFTLSCRQETDDDHRCFKTANISPSFVNFIIFLKILILMLENIDIDDRRFKTANISPSFMPLPVSQCKPQCHNESLTLARRVLKKSFQIPLTGVTAILWVWEWALAAEHLPLCQSVPPALQVLSTFPPEYKMQIKSVKRWNNNIQQYSTYLIAKTKKILLLILDQIQLKQEYEIKWTFRMVLICYI